MKKKKDYKPTRATPTQADKPNDQPAQSAELHELLDAEGHLRLDPGRATTDLSTHQDSNPTVPHQNVAAHQVLKFQWRIPTHLTLTLSLLHQNIHLDAQEKKIRKPSPKHRENCEKLP